MVQRANPQDFFFQETPATHQAAPDQQQQRVVFLQQPTEPNTQQTFFITVLGIVAAVTVAGMVIFALARR